MRTREFAQLKTVLAQYGQEIEQHISQPNYQKLKTMVKRWVAQKIRARNFEARNERIEKGVLVKIVMGNMSALEGNTENAVSVRPKDSAQREMLAVSATMKMSLEKQHNRLFLPKTANSRRREKFFEKGIFSEAAVLLERNLEEREKTTSVEIVRIRHVILGILPNVNVTKHNRDVNSVISASSCTKRLAVIPTRNQRKQVIKVLLLVEELQTIRLRTKT